MRRPILGRPMRVIAPVLGRRPSALVPAAFLAPLLVVGAASAAGRLLLGERRGRLGAVPFGGIGQVAPSSGDIWSADVLPAGGLGLRYQLTRAYPMHLHLDSAWGRDGGLVYFSVAEAF